MYSDVCVAWQRSMKSHDHVWPNIHEKGRLDGGGASEYRVCGWLQPRDNASTRVYRAAALLKYTHTHTHTIVFANGQSASHTTLSLFCSVFSHRHVTSSFNCPVLKPLTTAVMCRVCTHPACFVNVHELRGRAGRRRRKKKKKKVRPT